jgi:hypothetical protein
MFSNFNRRASLKKILRKTGLTRDQEGIYSRYLREGGFWDDHLNKTSDFILSCLDPAKVQSIAILGSGWCLDVPLKSLSECFQKIYLIDLRHPKMIRRRFEKLSNVEFIEFDLTGGMIEAVFTHIQDKYPVHQLIKKLQSLPAFGLPVEADYIISVNLLNQLDILLIDYITSKYQVMEKDLLPLRKYIQQTHLSMLEKGKSALICDFREIQYNTDGETVISKNTVFVDIPASVIKSCWTWNFDNHRTYHPNYNTRLEVIAAEF